MSKFLVISHRIAELLGRINQFLHCLILSGVKPFQRPQASGCRVINRQKLANRPKACKFHHLEKSVFVKAIAQN